VILKSCQHSGLRARPAGLARIVQYLWVLERRVEFPPSWKVLLTRQAFCFSRLSGYTHVVLKQRTKFIFVERMSSRKKLRTRAIACAALYILFNEEETKTKRKTWVKKW
jgi:hypothetical protein